MSQLLGALKGYRTYITFGLAFIVGGLSLTGKITHDQAVNIDAMLVPLGFGFMRAAIK